LIKVTEIFCLNEQGKRSSNQDHISPGVGAATKDDQLFIVCDGVGGENKGEVASRIVCSSIQRFMSNGIDRNGDGVDSIKNAIAFANEQLADYAVTDASAKRMSTTLSLIYLRPRSVLAAWCGDTRIHHIRDGKVLWKSQDHSLVGELVRSGEITEREATTHPQKNIITRSLNALKVNNTVDFHEINGIRNGDYFLLCSDGLLEQIDEEKIAEILNSDEVDKTASFSAYCYGHTRDNYSMYLVQVEDAPEPRLVKKKDNKKGMAVFAVLCLVILVVLFFLLR
jgi:PPM family protein phosphatase